MHKVYDTDTMLAVGDIYEFAKTACSKSSSKATCAGRHVLRITGAWNDLWVFVGAETWNASERMYRCMHLLFKRYLPVS